MEPESEQQAVEQRNRELLAAILRSTEEGWIELYGIWRSGSQICPPVIREDIELDRIVEPTFRFKENGFLMVHNPVASGRRHAR